MSLILSATLSFEPPLLQGLCATGSDGPIPCLSQLLKNEVRRLERNQEREKSVASLEYLKNVLLQFIFLKPGSERQALLPVIHTMLQLSPEEKSRLGAIALGMPACPRADTYLLSCMRASHFTDPSVLLPILGQCL